MAKEDYNILADLAIRRKVCEPRTLARQIGDCLCLCFGWLCTQETRLEERIGKNLKVTVAAALGVLLGAYLVQ